mgnify:CR=1 FL=1
MPKPIQLSDARYLRLLALAQQAGYIVKRGPGSLLGEFLDALMEAWDGGPPSVAQYNALVEGLEKISIIVRGDERGWFFRRGNRKVHGFDTAEAAIIAAIKSKIKS